MNQHSKNFTGDRNQIIAFTYGRGYSTYRMDDFPNRDEFFNRLEELEKQANFYLFTSYEELEAFLSED
jgi:hypothetical protein